MSDRTRLLGVAFLTAGFLVRWSRPLFPDVQLAALVKTSPHPLSPYGGVARHGLRPTRAPDRPRGAAVKAYWLEPRNERRSRREPGPGLTPYSVEQMDPDPQPWRDVGIKRGAAAISGCRDIQDAVCLPSCPLGMDHVLTSIALGPSRRPTKFPLRSYKLALRTVAIFAPLFAVAKNFLAVANYSDNLAGLRIDNTLVGVFLFCVSDVTFITPNSARCSGTVLVSADAERWRRCLLSSLRRSRLSASRAIGAGATVWRGSSMSTATPS